MWLVAAECAALCACCTRQGSCPLVVPDTYQTTPSYDDTSQPELGHVAQRPVAHAAPVTLHAPPSRLPIYVHTAPPPHPCEIPYIIPPDTHPCTSAPLPATLTQDVLARFQGRWELFPVREEGSSTVTGTRGVLVQDILPKGGWLARPV